jgi:hypothetical protein
MVRIRTTGGIAVACVALAMLASGCDWSMYRGGPERTGFNASESGDTAISTTNASHLHVIASTPVPGIKTGQYAQSSPVFGDGRWWLAGNDDKLHVLDTKGSQLAALAEPNVIPSARPAPAAPTVSGGTVYVGTGNRLYAWDTKTLAPKPWSGVVTSDDVVGSAIAGLQRWSPIVVPALNEVVVLGGASVVRVFSTADGHKIDEFSAGSDDLSAPPVVSGNRLYLGGLFRGGVYARDLTRQHAGWSVPGDTPKAGVSPCPGSGNWPVTGLALSGNTLIVERCYFVVQAHAVDTGKLLWTAKTPSGNILRPYGLPGVAYGKVYFMTENNKLQEVDLATGKQIRSLDVGLGPGGQGVAGSISIANGVLFTSPGLLVLDADTLALRFASTTPLSYDAASGSVSEAVVQYGTVTAITQDGKFTQWGL